MESELLCFCDAARQCIGILCVAITISPNGGVQGIADKFISIILADPFPKRCQHINRVALAICPVFLLVWTENLHQASSLHFISVSLTSWEYH